MGGIMGGLGILGGWGTFEVGGTMGGLGVLGGFGATGGVWGQRNEGINLGWGGFGDVGSRDALRSPPPRVGAETAGSHAHNHAPIAKTPPTTAVKTTPPSPRGHASGGGPPHVIPRGPMSAARSPPPSLLPSSTSASGALRGRGFRRERRSAERLLPEAGVGGGGGPEFPLRDPPGTPKNRRYRPVSLELPPGPPLGPSGSPELR